MRITLSNIVFLVLVSFSVVSCSKEEISAPAVDVSKANAKYDYTSEEKTLMNLVNEYRKNNGLNELVAIDFISIKSEEHNSYMISSGAVNHNFFKERYDALVLVVGAKSVSENLAYSYASPESAMNAWLNSVGHKENLDGDFTHFGISIRTNADGKKYYTNIFVKK
jgi:uncharacterized protein YkwD